MVRPAFVKFGGSVVTDKAREGTFRKPQTKRLVAELAKSGVPAVLFHGAGSFGHPVAARHGVGTRNLSSARGPVSATLAAVGLLHAEVVAAAATAGLEPVSVPLHLSARSEGDHLVDLPVEEVRALVEDGCTPVVAGTVVRDDRAGWRVASADEFMMALAHDLTPRLGLFVTDVDGVFDRDPADAQARLLSRVDRGASLHLGAGGGRGEDVTGRMAGKVARALALSEWCPVLIANGTVRGRVHDVLRGKSVPCTRVAV